jgi:peptide/nickel transport system substrate-binding protein
MPTEKSDGRLNQDSSAITRRRLITLGAQGAVLLGGASLLDACGGSSSPASSTTTTSSGKPVHGGTFTVGMITGGTAETLYPGHLAVNVDVLRTYQLFDRLFEMGPDIKSLVPGLALSADSNASATVWTLHLRPGVTWHDGKPFTADDVVYTIKTWSASTNFAGAIVGGVIDYGKVRKLGLLTVEVPLLAATAQFPSLLTSQFLGMTQAGSKVSDFATAPIGTGPFKFVSFQPGTRSVFAANRDYFLNGLPYVDSLIVDSSFTDENARLNALLSGQTNVSPILPFVLARTQSSAGQITVLKSPSGQSYFITMNVRKAPFTDVRVRQAMKLLADRPAMIEGAFAGYGTVNNDLLGAGAAYYDASLQRAHDVEQAKSLLKAAGQSGLTVTLQTSDVQPGYVESATLYAQQAKAGGVQISVQQSSPSVYFSSAGGFLTRAFAQDNAFASPSLTFAYGEFLSAKAPYNDTQWAVDNPAAQKLITDAAAAVDPSKAQELWTAVQAQQFNEGGVIGWGNSYYIDATGTDVKGLVTTPSGYLNNFNFTGGWIA